MGARIPFQIALALASLLSICAHAQQAKPTSPTQREPSYIAPSPKGGWKVTSKETRGAYSILESVVQPGTGPEPHRHSKEDEAFYVIEGQYEFRVGNQVIQATAGSFLFAPRGIPHTYKNVGTTASRHLTLISPGGIERFFAERAALIKEVPTTDPAYPARYQVLTEKYGLEYNVDWVFPPYKGE
jgi:quercetin dioxygenase-like cupin family protein